ncbi:MAG: adenine deaminase [Chlamydiales bacterium]|nr:adenine deaminase [Chlamydiales bacterium]
MKKIFGQIVDIEKRRIFPGSVSYEDDYIKDIQEIADAPNDRYILPGFIDAHIHIESSMVAPSEFARIAVTHGTVATVSDPHEIANVMGIEGIRFMEQNGRQVPFHFFFGASSCVPATTFETAGAVLTEAEIKELFEHDHLKYLSEMMNFPGVLNHDPMVMKKLATAKTHDRPIDGHAPGMRGDEAKRYIDEGISTDHECFTLEEAQEKLSYGMKILIREGSAAKNYEALHPVISSHPLDVMFCSDDKHPDELVQGHINLLVKRAIDDGHELFNVLHAACIAPIQHYGLYEVGRLRPGDSADFIVLQDLKNFKVLQTYIKGKLVAENGETLIPRVAVSCINNFHATPKKPQDFAIPANGTHTIRVIEVLDGQIITKELHVPAKIVDGNLVPDVPNDILKLTVVNRYSDAPPAVAFVKNFGLREGALASSIAHDSHNVIAVGCTDEELCQAVNAIINSKGGVATVTHNETVLLPLPIAGLMSPEDGWKVAELYGVVDAKAKEIGCKLHAPFMSLSFLALLVIPALKLSDKGLFDVTKFAFTDLRVTD